MRINRTRHDNTLEIGKGRDYNKDVADRIAGLQKIRVSGSLVEEMEDTIAI